jgi:hypothetical protein
LFNLSEPLLRVKQKQLDIQDLCGLLRIHWRIRQRTLLCSVYTRIDQVFILWGLITAAIFITAQFCPISWQFQAIFWSILTLIGTVGMVYLTNFWVTVEQMRWVAYLWTGLMLLGLGITNLGIFWSIPLILMNLCPLWLGLSALGYIIMALGMHSRTFMFIGILHLLGMGLLPYVMGWQFLTTGLIMTSCLLLLAELQWDMRPPIQSDFLTAEELNFNRRQHQLRQYRSS